MLASRSLSNALTATAMADERALALLQMTAHEGGGGWKILLGRRRLHCAHVAVT